MTLATTIALAAAETEHHGNVMAETFIFGVVAFVLFMALGLVVLSYRNVANRHAHKADAWAKANPAPEPPHGHH
jgi:NADH:ubiquinone oxidoreductase subunit K